MYLAPKPSLGLLPQQRTSAWERTALAEQNEKDDPVPPRELKLSTGIYFIIGCPFRYHVSLCVYSRFLDNTRSLLGLGAFDVRGS